MCLTPFKLCSVEAKPRAFLGKCLDTGVASPGIERKKRLSLDNHRRAAFGGLVGKIKKALFDRAEIRLISVEDQEGIFQKSVHGDPHLCTHGAGLKDLLWVAGHLAVHGGKGVWYPSSYLNRLQKPL